jgi:DNA-binding NarL/FixJ family response regulator
VPYGLTCPQKSGVSAALLGDAHVFQPDRLAEHALNHQRVDAVLQQVQSQHGCFLVFQPVGGDLAVAECIRSGIAAAKARGKRLGRQPGQRPKSDRLASEVMTLVAIGRSYRLIGREVGLSKNTVADIVKRHRAKTAQIA